LENKKIILIKKDKLMKKITQKEIVNQFIDENGLNKAEGKKLYQSFINILSLNMLKFDTKVYLKGIGTFENYETKERTARNIREGKTMKVPAKRRVKFKMSSSLKENLAKKKASKKPRKKVKSAK